MTQTIRGQPRTHFAVIASIALASVSLAALYLVLRESSGGQNSHAPRAHAFRIDISSGVDAMTARTLSRTIVFKARRGDTITLLATSTQPGLLHLHVYDRNVPLVPGGEVRLTFEATMAGAFPIHWHDPQGLMIQLAIVEVQPR